jgi:hypothetical protein
VGRPDALSNADNQSVLRHRHSNVLERTCAAAFLCDVYAEHEALIDIRTLEVIGGSLPRRALNLTIEWAIEHREELMEDWNLCQSKQHPKRIKPLE